MATHPMPGVATYLMPTSPVQSASYRVHIENLTFNVSKVALTDYLVKTCHLQFEPHIQMIRKDSGKYTGLCSAIFAVASKNALLHCVQQLALAQYSGMSHLLGRNKFTMNAKEAYLPGAKRLFRPETTHTSSEDSDVFFSVFLIANHNAGCSFGFHPKHHYFRLCFHGNQLRSFKRRA